MKFWKWIYLQRRICWTARPRLLWVIGFLVLQISCEWGGPPTIIVTAEEFRFSPTRIEWVSDQPLRLLIRNQGRERHVFHSQELFGPEANVLWHQPRVALQEANAVVLEPGQSIELSFTASAGLYPYRCWIKGHTGMEGTILIKDFSSS
ncbi:MAG: hypothetical protein H0W49_09765 [Nitrospirales bacterium]|nr:hypothetical protein [Nitrospirales bacterium]